MLKRRDNVVIGEVGHYTDKMSGELRTALTKLMQDINNVSESYKGIDADVEITKFLETANKINTVIKNLEYYGKYMQTVAEHDRENLGRTVKKLEEQKKQPSPLSSDASMQTLSLNTVNNIEGDING